MQPDTQALQCRQDVGLIALVQVMNELREGQLGVQRELLGLAIVYQAYLCTCSAKLCGSRLLSADLVKLLICCSLEGGGCVFVLFSCY